MSEIMLDGRLLSAAGYVRQNAVLADIGTDHGYLPLFLLESGRISRAILADINEGPLNTARENLSAAGFLSLVELVLTDGAAVLHDRGITDVTVCGMGGELIARIISEAEYLRAPGTRLILQPMTKVSHLRRSLASLGFEIIAERHSMADGRCYVCLVAEYTGEVKELSDLTAELGEASVMEGEDSLRRAYYTARLTSLLREREGRALGGLDTDYADRLIAELNTRLSALS